jgi:cysteinyl-tRNA synthetase
LQFSHPLHPPHQPPEIAVLLEERTTARTARDWAKSDTLRDALLQHGWVVKDTKEGTKLTRTGGLKPLRV